MTATVKLYTEHACNKSHTHEGRSRTALKAPIFTKPYTLVFLAVRKPKGDIFTQEYFKPMKILHKKNYQIGPVDPEILA